MKNIENILSLMDVTPEEVRIYLTLLEGGGDTAGNIAKKHSLKRSSLYGVLQKMTEKGVIKRTLRHGVRYFYAESPEALHALIVRKKEEVEKAQNDFYALIPQLHDMAKEKLFRPKLEIYDGREAIQNIMQDVLLYRDTRTLTLWPIRSMIALLSPDYFRWHNQKRIENNIYIQAIWPQNEWVSIPENPYMGYGPAHLRDIRVIEGNITARMGYWIYGNKIMFLSSQLEKFGFIIESADMAALQKDQWQILWNMGIDLPQYEKKMK